MAVRLSAIPKQLGAAVKTFSRWEKVLWGSLLLLLAGSWVLSQLARHFDAIDQMPESFTGLLSLFLTWLAWIQGIALTAIILQPLLRLLFNRNPAEKLATSLVAKRYPHLVNDLKALVSRGEARFDAAELKIVKDPNDLKLLSDWNSECFTDSANYAASSEQKLSRNLKIHSKFPDCFAFVQLPDGTPIGLSIVIPLNQSAAHLYRNGRLSDHDILDIHVSEPGEPCDCVLLFAIGMHPSFQPHGASGAGIKHIRRMLRSHVLHTYQVARQFDFEHVRFTVQAEKSSIIRLLKQFAFQRTNSKGFDGDPLYEIGWSDLKRVTLLLSPVHSNE